nr:MAG TPA: hypothetical protein [Caudoviricetes sp.]
MIISKIHRNHISIPQINLRLKILHLAHLINQPIL